MKGFLGALDETVILKYFGREKPVDKQDIKQNKDPQLTSTSNNVLNRITAATSDTAMKQNVLASHQIITNKNYAEIVEGGILSTEQAEKMVPGGEAAGALGMILNTIKMQRIQIEEK